MTRLLFSFLITIASTSARAADLVGVVVGISDGDTVTLLSSEGISYRIRLSEIDAPEKGQPFFKRSKENLANLCFQRRAHLLLSDNDRYGRIIGRLFCDGIDANREQVRTGMAWVYRAYARDPDLERLEVLARASRTGLWRDADPIPPWEWRRHQREKRIRHTSGRAKEQTP